MTKIKKYDDIIHLPHHVSSRHLQIPREKRAAQFAPFAALTEKNSPDQRHLDFLPRYSSP